MVQPIYYIILETNQIRRKRLARLQQSTRPATPSPGPSSDRSNQASGTSPQQDKPQPQEISKPVEPVASAKPPATTASSNTGSSPRVQTQSPAPQQVPAESLDQWTLRTLPLVLKIALNAETPNTIFLEEASQELETSTLAIDNVDQVLWYAIREKRLHDPTFISYLFSAWSRAGSIARSLKRNDPLSEQKTAVCGQIKLAIERFSVIICIADPEEKDMYSDFGSALLSMWTQDPWDYARAVLHTANEEGELEGVLAAVFDSVCRKVRQGVLSNNLDSVSAYFDYKPHLTLLEQLVVSDKQVAAAITMLDRFKIKPNYSALNIAYDTLLGPFLSLAPIDSTEMGRLFPNAETATPVEVERISTDIRVETKVLQDRLFYICDHIVRSSPVARTNLLRFLADVLKHNTKRLAMMQTRREEVCHDGFMLNIVAILERFCQPFVDSFGSKLDKIDADYFASTSCILDISEETKILTDNAESNKYYEDHKLEKDQNFISHVFFLMAGYMQYGVNGCITSLDRYKRMIDNVKSQVERLEQAVAAPSPQRNMLLQNLDMGRKALHSFHAKRLALQSMLNSEVLANSLISFSEFVLLFLIRVAEPQHKFPQNRSSLELPFPESSPPAQYSNFPEYLVDGIVSYLIYVSRYVPQAVIREKRNVLVQFCVSFLSTTPYIKNPYVKGKLVEILFYGTLEYGNHPGYFISIFDTDPLCLKYLLTGLMRFYIECEQTGASLQFYEKFTTRFYISEIIRCIWANDAYRAKLDKESKDDVKFFVRFVALLLNDVTYLLDESLTKLGDIHRLQREIADNPALADVPLDPQDASSTSNNEDNEDNASHTRATSLASAERQAKSCMQLANKSVLLLKMFTSAVPKAFVLPEIVDRLAAMLNYNLAALVGPRCNELKVTDPEKYGFNPKNLLSDMSEVYVNLRFEEAFVKAVARDGRSFSPANIDRAIQILDKWGLQPVAVLERLQNFKAAAEQARQEEEEGELELGDVPDEFLDPLMFTLMEEPVTLPSSKVVIDLGTIKSHLLSDPKDPFNRAPLKIEDVIPNTELKEKIEAWKREQREAFRKEKEAAANQDVQMTDA